MSVPINLTAVICSVANYNMSGLVNSDEEKQRVAEQRERKKKKKRAMKEAGKQKLVGEASV
jgi:hypothetical protein